MQHIFAVCLLVRSSVCCSFVRSFDPSFVRAHLLAWLFGWLAGWAGWLVVCLFACIHVASCNFTCEYQTISTRTPGLQRRRRGYLASWYRTIPAQYLSIPFCTSAWPWTYRNSQCPHRRSQDTSASKNCDPRPAEATEASVGNSARPTMQHELPLARHGDSPSARKVAGEEPDPCRTPPSQRCGFCVQSSLPWAAGFWIQACTEGDSHRLLLEASKSAQPGIDRSRIRVSQQTLQHCFDCNSAKRKTVLNSVKKTLPVGHPEKCHVGHARCESAYPRVVPDS